ncbi:MAG: UbiA family prenyltransferase, partial [Alphaproteobacteria bacterium]|nr:UbiA family prenyltransferase [Alphaproteobacteria bacterium]
FWALALFSQNDYAAAGFPMLPNTHGVVVTKRHILTYTALLFPIGLLPYVLGTVGEIYALAALVLGVVFLQRAWRLFRAVDTTQSARGLFSFSIVYLFALFGALLLDKYAFLAWGMF